MGENGVLEPILCVDDEQAVLDGLRLSLHKAGAVSVALSGQAGLDWIAEHGAPSVVISDMHMPGMDGVEFLRRVRELTPDSSRLLLTGRADMDVAITAVNKGQIFRFLTKPCPKQDLSVAVYAALEQHRLVTAEKVLLEQTLKGCAQTLVDLLALADPAGFGRAQRIRRIVLDLTVEMGSAPSWQMDIAGLLAQIGCVTLNPDLSQRLARNLALERDEQALVDRLPEVAAKLLAGIPRFEDVRSILLASLPDRIAPGQVDDWGQAGRILRLATELEPLTAEEAPSTDFWEGLRARWSRIDPGLTTALQSLLGEVYGARPMVSLPLAALKEGMVLAQDVRTGGGMVLFSKGSSVTQGLLEKLANIKKAAVLEPVFVLETGTGKGSVPSAGGDGRG